MKKIAVLCFAVATCFYACATDTDIHNAGLATRKAWVELAERLALPVLKPMAEGRLHEKLNYEKGTLEISPSWDGRSKEVAYMEAFARLMAGIAPWLALPDDRYTNNGSLYVTSLFLLPLGLPANDSFWTSPDGPWTSVKAWSGESFPKDHKWPINPQPLYWE